MTYRSKTAAVVASLLAAALLSGSAIAADQASGPTVTKALAKPLKAASDALEAKKYDEALAHIKEAQAVAGDKTAYDTWVIEALKMKAYQGQGDTANLMADIQDMVGSQYTNADQQKVFYKALAQYAFQQKDYAKALDMAEQAQKHGNNDADTETLIAKAQYLTGKYKDATATMTDVVSKMDKPDEESLKILWQFNLQSKDDAGASKALEKLVTLYPKPDYWANALASLVKQDIKDGHLQLDVYRLMRDVGVLKLPTDYSEMAELAFDQGYPGEAASVLTEAFDKKVFTTPSDQARWQHTLDGAKQRAATDQASLAKQEADAASAANGDAYVGVGAAYLSYAQYDKAIAALQKGIAKGGLKYADEDNLLLGIAQLRAKQTADAKRSFDKVAGSSNAGFARLGRLWALRAGGAAA